MAALPEDDDKMPAYKKQRLLAAKAAEEAKAAQEAADAVATVIVQFKTQEGEVTGSQLELPFMTSTQQLESLINELLSNEEKTPYSFFLNDEEIMSSIKDAVNAQKLSTENALTIVYQPQAIFRVRPVTRCMSDLPGHSEAVLAVSFSPDGSMLASGGGDTTVRVWDLFTNTPQFTMQGHKNWVLTVSWSPNANILASAGMDNEVRLWNPRTGKPHCPPLRGHGGYVTSLAWEPIHLNPACEHIASGSKDGTIKIWNIRRQVCVQTLSGHTNKVSALRWGGSGLLYSASHDRTIKVWDPVKGILVRTLEGHGHWVTTLSLNTDYVLRTGAFDRHGLVGEVPAGQEADEKAVQDAAKAKYDKIVGKGSELLVSGSDDFTLFLWDPVKSKKAITRMTGHQQPITQVSFSPDGRTIASCSFDRSVKLWQGGTGKYINSLRSHVEAVYQIAWSGDSRLCASASRDSTIKVWEIRTQKRLFELPGHADEVYAVDWAPDGDRVASGSKDRMLKIWSK